MAEPKKPNDDGRIEDLLSQLQGIFGKLSQSEEEESRDKVDIPAKAQAAAQEPAAPLPPAPAAPEMISEAPAPEPPPVADQPAIPAAPTPEPPPAPVETPPPSAPAEELVVPMSQPAAPEPPPATPSSGPATFEASDTPTAIFFPSGRETEAQALKEKLETLTPKFTKVTFRLKVGWSLPYDPKSDWRESLLSQVQAAGPKIVFIVAERPLDEPRRKAIVAALEQQSIYFQDVPLLSIEKRAFYTDLLLGLVFFFDSIKPKQNP